LPAYQNKTGINACLASSLEIANRDILPRNVSLECYRVLCIYFADACNTSPYAGRFVENQFMTRDLLVQKSVIKQDVRGGDHTLPPPPSIRTSSDAALSAAPYYFFSARRLHILSALAGAAELVGAAGIRRVGLAVVAGVLLIVGVLHRLLGVRLLHAVLRWLTIREQLKRARVS
jgi:hypothetical protein